MKSGINIVNEYDSCNIKYFGWSAGRVERQGDFFFCGFRRPAAPVFILFKKGNSSVYSTSRFGFVLNWLLLFPCMILQ